MYFVLFIMLVNIFIQIKNVKFGGFAIILITDRQLLTFKISSTLLPEQCNRGITLAAFRRKRKNS